MRNPVFAAANRYTSERIAVLTAARIDVFHSKTVKFVNVRFADVYDVEIRDKV